MKLQIRTVKSGNFDLEVKEDATVLAIKEMLEASHGVAAPTSQRLIYQGRVLTDALTLAEVGLRENDFLVLMVSEKKAAPAPPAPPAAPPPAEPAPAPAAPPAPAPAPAPAPPAAVLAPEAEAAVDNLCQMGFERSQVIAALSAAYGNADRAVEYLFNGIPDDLLQQDADDDAAGAPPPAPPAAPVAPAAPPPAAPQGGPFTADAIMAALNQATPAPQTPMQRMLAEPQLVQLIAMARQNPNLVQGLLEELSRSNPPLLQLVQQNQADFMALLNGQEPLPSPSVAPPAAPAAGGAPPQGGPVQIQVTTEEKEAIDRLQALGFPREAVLQAFLACDKDENLAANLLFDGM